MFFTQGYCKSKNCMRELKAAVDANKPLILLLESEAKHGGLSPKEIMDELKQQENGKELTEALFANKSISWQRLPLFRDVMTKCIAARLLEVPTEQLKDASTHGEQPPGNTGNGPNNAVLYPTIIPGREGGELYTRGEYLRESRVRKLLRQYPKPRYGKDGYHLYVSSNNEGASALVKELEDLIGKRGKGSGCFSNGGLKIATAVSNEDRLRVELRKCNAMLVYLNRATWTTEPASSRLADEVRLAIEEKTPLLLVYEYPGVEQDESHCACEFDFIIRTTPQDLVEGQALDRSVPRIYDQMAKELKGGEYREVSLARVLTHLATNDTATRGDVRVARRMHSNLLQQGQQRTRKTKEREEVRDEYNMSKTHSPKEGPNDGSFKSASSKSSKEGSFKKEGKSKEGPSLEALKGGPSRFPVSLEA